MDRKKWYAVVAVLGGAAALAVYLAPYAEARQSLIPLGVNAILTKSRTLAPTDAFGETLEYENSLLPPGAQLSGLLNLPVPDGDVSTLNLYQNSRDSWRLEEMNQQGAVVGVVARDAGQLVTYRSQANQRTVNQLPRLMQSSWSVWPIPQPDAWRKDWVGKSSRTRVAGVPAYQVTLRPKNHQTLWGSVTYWFQGRYFVPLGVRVTDKGGSTVFEAKASVFTQGAPGNSADPPSAGRRVAWRVSPALARVSGNFRGSSASLPPFPSRLGPLVRTSQRTAGSTAVALYGQGPGRVVALVTSRVPLTGKDTKEFLKPIPGVAGFKGVTDGVFSVVTFQVRGREVTLMGSRTETQLARWAKSEWH